MAHGAERSWGRAVRRGRTFRFADIRALRSKPRYASQSSGMLRTCDAVWRMKSAFTSINAASKVS